MRKQIRICKKNQKKPQTRPQTTTVKYNKAPKSVRRGPVRITSDQNTSTPSFEITTAENTIETQSTTEIPGTVPFTLVEKSGQMQNDVQESTEWMPKELSEWLPFPPELGDMMRNLPDISNIPQEMIT